MEANIRRQRLDLSLVATGAVAAVLLVAVSTADGLTRGDGYRITDHWVSLLSRGDRWWLGVVNLAVCGTAMLVASIGFRSQLSSSRSGRIAANLVALLGAAILFAAAFPVDPAPTYPTGSTPATTAAGAVHSVAGAAVLLLFPAVAAVTAWQCRSRRRWACAAAACAVAAVTAVAACVGLAALRGTQRWDLVHAGAFQRVALTAGAAGVVLLALWTLHNAPRQTPPG